MNKNTKILVSVILILVLISAIAIMMNRDNAAAKKELNDNAVFILMDNGEEIASYNMTEIQAIGETDFTATLDTSTTDPEDFQYTGVLMKSIFEHAGISLEGREAVIVSAVDGYTVAVPMDKFMADDNVYLAYKKEGELIGTREEGGKGPYQMIISKDQFSQFWCKYAISADIQ
ncbi:Oxidoreductase molybdopterin binding domain-containing protein [Dethiosulfatibacter aminovorans DSM 17477]|uniref:Oxidoreductase molybdopterin binding domain-containing protein n=1 Tax=Dethiosulfatibacter aminovorans DSM 17477 TaxID=1121476 RepID=A0A1M6HHP9_9FIRM|nr:molybdopterin-dependent oxidoreductase [Dethiosulfatibacter aminovorans]SHJ21721.1 Oxidoreductase molybdopterin binding domain-containing protein [Dethiosulfatibacter aminovorans DSM 17477]